MYLVIIILIVLFIVIFIFSSPTLSPIPYFPSQSVDLPKIIKALDLKNNQTVIDLGAGDGIIIFKAAKESLLKKLSTKFIAVEINPVLILILCLRRLFHPNRKNIRIIYGDIFKTDFMNLINFKNFITIYLYISPWFLEKVIENCKLKIENFHVISYMYPIKSLKESEKVIQGKNKIFVYH
jgi:16S rRNA A1518/A1519 N6-dimethyltransferase RsmA/KsgA/DIM1 with predicted DNA glycosylase/AP lyase activity